MKLDLINILFQHIFCNDKVQVYLPIYSVKSKLIENGKQSMTAALSSRLFKTERFN